MDGRRPQALMVRDLRAWLAQHARRGARIEVGTFDPRSLARHDPLLSISTTLGDFAPHAPDAMIVIDLPTASGRVHIEPSEIAHVALSPDDRRAHIFCDDELCVAIASRPD